jgi:uncharacterized membrane protein HdeD (DUF308 family)
MKQRFVETHPAHPKRILSISYARGVDESPSGETSAKASRSTPDTGDKSKDLGETQMDYIRRAQSEMAKVNQELVAQDRRVTAVGILGTDIYDKMVILQAVKPIFPKAVVFTTDLDATHSDSSQYKRNRNLLVAGTYGLALHPELQGSIPPFREGLQTSTFFATLEAVGFDVAETMRPHVNVPSGAKLVPGFVPRIFEIGWSGPYDLTGHQGVSPEAPVVVNTSRKAMLGAKGEARIVDINPRSRRGRVVVAWIETHDWELAILIGGAFALTVFGSDKLKRKLWPTKPSPGAEAGSPAEAWIVIALTAFALLAIRWQLPGIARDGDGEPVEFFEGISVWPSIVLRGVLVVLAFVFWYRIARTRWRLPDANGQQRVPPSLHDAFKASFNALRRWTWGRDGARASGFRNAWKIVQGNGVKRTCEGMWTSWQTMWLSRWNSLPVNDGDSEAVYAELEKRLDWRWLSLRMVAVVAGLIVVFFLVNVPYPEAPARGFARHLDRDLSFASWSAVIAIAILVNRVVRTVRRFAELKLKDYRDKFTALSIEQAGAFSTRCLRDCQRLRDISKAALDNLYPASILVCILILCYNPYFDAWHWSLVLPGAFLFVSIVVISNAWSLGRTIQRVRTEIVERLRNVAEEGATKDVKDIICARSDRILALDGGAFTRFVDMPLVRAIMIPVSGAGGISLIQYLTPFLS